MMKEKLNLETAGDCPVIVLARQLSLELEAYFSDFPEVGSGRKDMARVEAALSALRAELERSGFADPDSETLFFKHLKPMISRWLVFLNEWEQVVLLRPLEGGKALKLFYKSRLKSVQRLFLRQGYFYQYYKFGDGALDGMYFQRGIGTMQVPGILPGEVDPGFDTPVGMLVARFMGMEMLAEHLLSELYRLQAKPELSAREVSPSGEVTPRMRWTGEVVNLIELAHGLFLTGQVNQGETGVVEFFKLLGEFFGVNLRVPKRGFDDLKSRKTMSRTNYLDQMREALLKKMDEEDFYDPDQLRRRKGFF
jgi:hypothetical protein